MSWKVLSSNLGMDWVIDTGLRGRFYRNLTIDGVSVIGDWRGMTRCNFGTGLANDRGTGTYLPNASE